MYKFDKKKQISLMDFDQPLGLKMEENNRWVNKAALIPWETIELEYAKLFPSKTDMPAKPLRMALGALLIQKQYRYADEELIEQIKENPYYQYFIGLPGYTNEAPFVPSLMVEFRKRLSEDVLNEINEMIIEFNQQQNNESSDSDNGNIGNNGTPNADNSDNDNSQSAEAEQKNEGTLIIDATCAPQNIKYPQDIELLNEVREKLENLICKICNDYNFQIPICIRLVKI